MLKILKILSVLILVAIITAYIFLPNIILKQITDYDQYTFEYVLTNPKLVSDYGIPGKRVPADYNFASEDVQFKSQDGTKLEGWYIKAKKPSNRCIIFAHGRTSNRLKTMKYLSLVDSLDLDTLYNVFIPDFRNSGTSATGSTYMGYKFGEDLAASIKCLNESYEQESYILYGFSMGAMAIGNALYRPDLKAHYADNIHFEKVILDSPLANVKETLRKQAGSVPAASHFFDRIFALYSQEIDGFGESMKLSLLLDPAIPTLVLQSKDDKTTDISILETELAQIDKSGMVSVVVFEGPGHVRIFQDSTTRVEYIASVRSFLEM